MTDRCKLCNGRGHTVEDGKEVICKCRLLPSWKIKLGPLVNCGKVSDRIKEVVNQLIATHPQDKFPKHYLIKDKITDKGTEPRFWYKGFLAYYLVKSKEFLDFKYVDFGILMESFFTDKPEATSMSNDVRYFDLSCQTLVLVINRAGRSTMDEEVLSTFLDTYKSRNVFLYFSNAAQRPVKKWDNNTKTEATVSKGIHQLLENPQYADFIDIGERWGLYYGS